MQAKDSEKYLEQTGLENQEGVMKQEVYSEGAPRLMGPVPMTEEVRRAWLEAYELWYGDNVPEILPKTVQTMTLTYKRICEGEDPWTALSGFINAWYGYAKRRRESLVSESISRPEESTLFLQRWAAFCAASVEFLCDRYGVPCPDWPFDECYTLSTIWWGTVPKAESYQEISLKTTPEPFKRRNIYCGNRLFQNKYELATWSMEALAKGITDPAERGQYIREKEASIHGG